MSIELAGWLIAAMVFGLWWGERGRRLDAQRREGVLQVDRVKRATSVTPDSVDRQDDTYRKARERYVTDTMAEVQCTRAEAEAEFDAMMSTVSTDSHGAMG